MSDFKDHMIAIKSAWKESYCENHHRLLLNNLNSLGVPKDPHANQIAIVQASGTGKSRMVHEMAQLVFTIPFNIRDSRESLDGAYPPPDNAVRNFLSAANYAPDLEVKNLTFLRFLFTQVADELEKCQVEIAEKKITEAEDLAKWWSGHLDDARTRLYKATLDDAENVVSLQPKYDQHIRDSAKRALERLINKLKTWGGSRPIKLVMYFDEAHTLASVRPSGYTSAVGARTLYDLFCSCLNEFLGSPMMVIFISTSLSLANPRAFAGSARIRYGEAKIHAPITETPFDCCKDLLVKPGTLTMHDISKFTFMAQFGRPLFWTLAKGLISQADYRHYEIKELACAKLTGIHGIYDSYGACPYIGIMAVLDVQLSLDFEPRSGEARTQQAAMVESHMRFAYSIPAHREYIQSGYPSEPLIAEAAAEQLWRWKAKNPSLVSDMLYSDANGRRQCEILDHGELKELIGRQLLLDAYHRAVELEQVGPRRCGPYSPPNFSAGCKLITFIQTLFVDEYAEMVLDSKPDNMEGASFKTAFENAHVCFTHFGKMGDSSGLTSTAAWAAFIRHMAMLYQSGKDSVDCILPVLLWDAKICEHVMTGVLVQFKRRRHGDTPAEYGVDQSRVGFFPRAPKSGCTHEPFPFYRPYVSLVMELKGQLDYFKEDSDITMDEPDEETREAEYESVHRPRTSPPHQRGRGHVESSGARLIPKDGQREEGHARYNILAHGCSEAVYRCINNSNKKFYAHLLDPDTYLKNNQNIGRTKPSWTRGEVGNHWIV